MNKKKVIRVALALKKLDYDHRCLNIVTIYTSPTNIIWVFNQADERKESTIQFVLGQLFWIEHKEDMRKSRENRVYAQNWSWLLLEYISTCDYEQECNN